MLNEDRLFELTSYMCTLAGVKLIPCIHILNCIGVYASLKHLVECIVSLVDLKKNYLGITFYKNKLKLLEKWACPPRNRSVASATQKWQMRHFGSRGEVLTVRNNACDSYGSKEIKKVRRLSGPGMDTATIPGVTAGGGKWPSRWDGVG